MKGIDFIHLLTKTFPTRDFSKYVKEVDNIWNVFEENGFIKPKNLKSKVNDRTIFYKLFDRAIGNYNISKEKIFFKYISTNDFNSFGNYTSNGDYIILFDEKLFSKLIELVHSFMILSNISLYENERTEIYRFIEHSFASFNNKNITENEKIEYYPVWKKLLIKDPEIFNWSVITVYVIFLFILSHEIGHYLLKHNKRNERSSENIHKYEYDADIFGFKNIQKINSNYNNNIYINITKDFVNMPIIYFDIMDLYYDWCKSNNIQKNVSHPEPIKRKKQIINQFKIKKIKNTLYSNICDEIYLYKTTKANNLYKQ